MRLVSCTWIFPNFANFLFTAMANNNLDKRANPSGQLFSNDTSCPFPISTASCAYTISSAIRPVTTLTKSAGWLYGSGGATQVRRFRTLSLSFASEVRRDGFSFAWLVTTMASLLHDSSPPLEKRVGYSLYYWKKFQKFGPHSENSSRLLVSHVGYGPPRHLPLSTVIKHVRDILCSSSLLKEANHHTFRTIPQEHWSIGMSMACPS